MKGIWRKSLKVIFHFTFSVCIYIRVFCVLFSILSPLLESPKRKCLYKRFYIWWNKQRAIVWFPWSLKEKLCMRTMALRLTKYSSILYGSLIVYGSTSTHCTQLTHYAGPTYISINTLLTVYSLLRISCIFQPIATCADPTRYLHATNIHDILTATKGRFAVRSPLSLAHL